MEDLLIKVSRRRRRGQQGFTLIELLVVIAVLAILAAIVVFNVVGVSDRGKTSACQTDKATVQTAVDAYYNDPVSSGGGGGKFPVTGGDTATPAAGADVNYTELIDDHVLHTAPAETFTYTGSSGTIGGGGC